jgi:hypothetical protein
LGIATSHPNARPVQLRADYPLTKKDKNKPLQTAPAQQPLRYGATPLWLFGQQAKIGTEPFSYDINIRPLFLNALTDQPTYRRRVVYSPKQQLLTKRAENLASENRANVFIQFCTCIIHKITGRNAPVRRVLARKYCVW